MSIERNFDIPFVSDLALREKQIQQNYRPIIAVHKWFARRPGTLFRSLLLAEFGSDPLATAFYQPNKLTGRRIVDPFMGGGTPLIEANRLDCSVVGCDINPMAYWTVRQEIEHLDLPAYREAARKLQETLAKELGDYYSTTCKECGASDASAKYFLWVKTQPCSHCGKSNDLMPGYLIAEDRRHPKNVVMCAFCGELAEVADRRTPGKCPACQEHLILQGPASRTVLTCRHCGQTGQYPDRAAGAPKHRMFAIEYYCGRCRNKHEGRYFKKPDAKDLKRFEAAAAKWEGTSRAIVPDDEIPAGVETNRLHRWGYRFYREMFNERQLLGLETSGQLILKVEDDRVRNALATNLSDLLRYQNMLCRYDTAALKSLDIFSVHGFPVGLVQCESNLLGIVDGSDKNIGSGGWSNITSKYDTAKAYCDEPFEIRQRGTSKVRVPVEGEWIGDRRNGAHRLVQRREVRLMCTDSAALELAPGSVDAVFTDPPYFANVQYAELMDFCYVWLRRLLRGKAPFNKPSTRIQEELTGNEVMGRGVAHFTEGLARVFVSMGRALKPGAPLAFTYHHNVLDAYYPVAVAMLDAGLTCSASIPCPGEMGGSIHISGTGSSIIDTVFVCRSTGLVPRRWVVEDREAFRRLVSEDVNLLRAGGVSPTRGDIRCLSFGHLIRLAVWRLRHQWDTKAVAITKMKLVADAAKCFGSWMELEEFLGDIVRTAPARQWALAKEGAAKYGKSDDIPF